MQEFISTVDGIEASMKGPSDKALGSYVPPPPGGIRKKGLLYKQRDVFKGWRQRYFVLQDSLLMYYLNQDDQVAKNTLDVTGCTVTSVKPVSVDNMEYFPFVITHPKSGVTYNLSSDNKLDADSWIARILEAAATPESMTTTQIKPSERLLQRVEHRASIDEPVEDAAGNSNVVNSVLTLAGIPKKFASKIERAMDAMLDAVPPNSEGWEPLFEKANIQAFKRAGDVICVRGDTVMPYCLLDVFEVIMNIDRQTEIDPMQKVHTFIKKYSSHTWSEYIGFKGVSYAAAAAVWRSLTAVVAVGVAHESQRLHQHHPLAPAD